MIESYAIRFHDGWLLRDQDGRVVQLFTDKIYALDRATELQFMRGGCRVIPWAEGVRTQRFYY